MSLVGPSGSGKSSLLRAVIGLQKPLAGTVETEVAPTEIGILFQDDALLPWKTARDNVALGLTFNGVERAARARAGRHVARTARTDRFRPSLSAPPQRRPAQARRARAGAGDDAEAAADGRAVRLARRHRARPHHPGRRRAGRARTHQRAPGHPRPRRSDQPVRRGLSALARAARAHHPGLCGVDPAAARPGARARASGVRAALRQAVGGSLARGRPRPRREAADEAARSRATPGCASSSPLRSCSQSGRRQAAPACSTRCSRRARAASARRSSSCSRTAASGRISKQRSARRSAGLRSASWSGSCSA